MEKYESIGVVGEGSYGIVMKCRHKESGQIVAIKKFIETEDDHNIRKMALREIRMLKKLRHDNLVNMIEVFRRKRRFYLVFEYMDHTVLDELEENPKGLGEAVTRQHMFQVIRGIDFCHKNNIVHRDVKPENILISKQGVLKLCDFGFARLVSTGGETYTDYVATRWYRAPELLVGDTKYGRPVDIWAIGCLFAEMMCGDPLFPGESDIDQIYLIVRLLGKLCPRHQQLISKNSMLKELRKSTLDYADEIVSSSRCLYKIFPSWSNLTLDIVSLCLSLDPSQRPTSFQLLQHSYFTEDKFADIFLPDLKKKIEEEINGNPLLSKIYSQLMEYSTDKKGSSEIILPKRSHQVDFPRWKMNQPNDKLNLGEKRVLRNLDKTSNSNKMTLDNVIDGVEDATVENINNNNINTLNKYCPLVGLLKPFKDQASMSFTHFNNSTNSLSVSPFQSLTEPDKVLLTPTSSQSGLLHPSVNNISFIDSFRSECNKKVGPSKSNVGIVPKVHLGKKIEEKVTTDMESRTSWRIKGPNDSFSLPNLPGASLSPYKAGKKLINPVLDHGIGNTFISPMQKSRSPSISPQSKVLENLPLV